MLRILGSRKTLCQGISRREMLRVGGLGLAGLGLPELLQLEELSAAKVGVRPKSFGKAKAVILIHLYGSPSQLEWADPKPNAPVEIRGQLKSISSSLTGCGVCELLPTMAKVMDRTTVLRSMTHPYPIHGVAFAQTGIPVINAGMELRPRDQQHWPFFGSVVDYVESRQQNHRNSVPSNIALPFSFSSRRVGEVPRAGPYGGFLGSQYDPVWTNLIGKATKGRHKTLGTKTYTQNDPYIGLSDDSYFVVPSASSLLPGVTLDRLNRRKSLLTQLNEARPHIARTAAAESLTRHQQAALALLQSGKLASALDPRHEKRAVRDLYGSTLFGQSCLTARRLVEAGSRVVSVFWDEYGLAGSAWDTHWKHYERLKQELCPGLDRGWYGLITDLDQRGLLDETLVVCTSEHGRTPKLDNHSNGGGRGHWSRAYTTLVAGGGVARGHIVGATDNIGGDVIDRPISPKDLQATMYHLLGIDHHLTIPDRGGRHVPLVDGRVITEALA